MTEIEDAIKIEAKQLLLGNICNNCENLYPVSEDNNYCDIEITGTFYMKIKLDHTCELWKQQL